MRSADASQAQLFVSVDMEERVPAKHPLRAVRTTAATVLGELRPRLDQAYQKGGRFAMPPEQVLRALVLWALYSVPSERQLLEQPGIQPALPLVRRAPDRGQAVVARGLPRQPPPAPGSGRGGGVPRAGVRAHQGAAAGERALHREPLAHRGALGPDHAAWLLISASAAPGRCAQSPAAGLPGAGRPRLGAGAL